MEGAVQGMNYDVLRVHYTLLYTIQIKEAPPTGSEVFGCRVEGVRIMIYYERIIKNILHVQYRLKRHLPLGVKYLAERY